MNNEQQSKTPETDAAEYNAGHGDSHLVELVVPSDFARTLEQQRDEARANTYTELGYGKLLERVARMEDALRKAKHALTWSKPTAGAACAGEVTQQMAEQWFDEANDAIDEALSTTQPPAKE